MNTEVSLLRVRGAKEQVAPYEREPDRTRTGVSIRRATDADKASLVEHTIAHALEIEGLHLDIATVAKGITQFLNDADLVGLVACTETGDVVGSCLMGARELRDRRGGWAWWITSIYVAKPFRRQGIGSALEQELFRLARAAGVLGLRTYIFRGNTPSFQSHKKMGFKPSEYDMIELDLT